MANIFSAVINLGCDALVELDEAVLPAFSERSLRLNGFSSKNILESDDLTFIYANSFTSGQTLDLTNLDDSLFGVQDLTGETLQAILVNNNSISSSSSSSSSSSTTEEPSSSISADLTISGSYPILGGTLVVPASGKLLLYKPSSQTVDSTHKTIVFSGSSDYEVVLIF